MNNLKRTLSQVVPVVLFAYKRASVLARVLDGLRLNNIPLLIVYCDGAKSPEDEAAVKEVRDIIKTIDWCHTKIINRSNNLGLGRSLRAGITEVLTEYDRIVVFEDDIVCVPGTYQYLCDALEFFEDFDEVMSIAAWTYPSLRPAVPSTEGYFDGRFACWGWGTWKRSWRGMDIDAETLLKKCQQKGKNVDRYGSDLKISAEQEQAKNTWAIRFALLHILKGGLCYHPPYSLVQNIGFGPDASNTQNTTQWNEMQYAYDRAPDFSAPLTPIIESDGVDELWRKAIGTPGRRSFVDRLLIAKWQLAAKLRNVFAQLHHKKTSEPKERVGL